MLSNNSSSSDDSKSPLWVKQDGKFYSRLLSKESSLANPSFRVVPGSVPFLWESKPGIPKDVVTAVIIPPITPPPSYHFHPNSTTTNNNNNKNRVLTMMKTKTSYRLSFFASAVSHWFTEQGKSSDISSSSRSILSPQASFCKSESSCSTHPDRQFSSFRSDYQGSDDDCSPRSFLCFRVRSS